jgi:hypothetical protein
MRWVGCVVAMSGWLIVAAAVVLLRGMGGRGVFVGAGVGVEVLGVGVLMGGYRVMARERMDRG